MQQATPLYFELLAAGAQKEVRAVIATGQGNESYTTDRIVSAKARSAMMDKGATIGSCIAKELDLVLRDPGIIPRMAKIVMQYRLNDGTRHSEWIYKGTFFVDTREIDSFGVISIHAYDAMLMAEQFFPAKAGNRKITWPMTDVAAAKAIQQIIGVNWDARNNDIMTAEYSIPDPGSGEKAYTMREALGFIGAMYGGNWIVTDDNKLRLILLGDIPADTSNLLIDEHGRYITIGGDRIIVG